MISLIPDIINNTRSESSESKDNNQTNPNFGPEAVNKVMRKRWMMFILMVLASFFVQFHRNSSGIIKADLMNDFGLSATSFSMFSSVYFYSYVLMQLPVGILCDRWGVRKTVSLGSFVSAAGTLMFAMSKTFETACIGRLLIGIGVSVPVVAVNKLLTSWFRENEIVSVGGLGSLLGSFGGIISQAPLALMVAVFTWRSTFITVAVISFLISALCLLALRDSPQDIGLPSLAFIEGRETTLSIQKKQKSIKQVLRNVVANRGTWPLLICMPALMGAYTVFSGTWGVPYIEEVFGYSNIEASVYTSYTAIGMSISSFAISIISDRIRSRKKPLVLISLLTFTIWFFLCYMQQFIIATNSLGVIMFLFGFTASSVPMMFAIVREVNDPEYVGISIGLTNTVGMLSSAVFPIICGRIMDANSNVYSGGILYQKTFQYILILTGIACISSFFTKETHGRNIYGA